MPFMHGRAVKHVVSPPLSHIVVGVLCKKQTESPSSTCVVIVAMCALVVGRIADKQPRVIFGCCKRKMRCDMILASDTSGLDGVHSFCCAVWLVQPRIVDEMASGLLMR